VSQPRRCLPTGWRRVDSVVESSGRVIPTFYGPGGAKARSIAEAARMNAATRTGSPPCRSEGSAPGVCSSSQDRPVPRDAVSQPQAAGPSDMQSAAVGDARSKRGHSTIAVGETATRESDLSTNHGVPAVVRSSRARHSRTVGRSPSIPHGVVAADRSSRVTQSSGRAIGSTNHGVPAVVRSSRARRSRTVGRSPSIPHGVVAADRSSRATQSSGRAIGCQPPSTHECYTVQPGMCGTLGCQLPDNHVGLCTVEQVVGKRRRV
jgi:hypothetical protein